MNQRPRSRRESVNAPRRRLPVAPQWIFLALAAAWAVVSMIVVTRYHLNQPRGETSVTINGQTYRGSPPSLTLAQSKPGLYRTLLVALVAALALGVGDFLLRVTHQQRRPGYGAIGAGGLIALFSLFGLLWGVASLGVVGVLIVLSARPLGMTQRAWIASRYLPRSP